jgi:hypothetical protein
MVGRAETMAMITEGFSHCPLNRACVSFFKETLNKAPKQFR